jgi:hypothetical protein
MTPARLTTPTAGDRAFRIHCAKVHLAECSRRRRDPVSRNFYWRLFAWAQKCRREAAAMRLPAQQALFGEAE